MENDQITAEQPARRHGDVWAKTLDGFRAPLIAFARRLTRHWSDAGDAAEDIAQNAIIRVANARTPFDPAVGSIQTLLFVTARRLYLNELRDRRSRAAKVDELSAIHDDADDATADMHRDAAAVEHVDHILDQLTPRERGVLRAAAEKVSYDVIATTFGFNSAGHCRKFAYDLRQRIRRRYQDETNSYLR